MDDGDDTSAGIVREDLSSRRILFLTPTAGSIRRAVGVQGRYCIDSMVNKENARQYVSRAGLKLEHAPHEFQVGITGLGIGAGGGRVVRRCPTGDGSVLMVSMGYDEMGNNPESDHDQTGSLGQTGSEP